MTNKLPKFYGKPLIEIPAIVPVANFLEGYFGKAFLEEYNGRVEKDYKNSSKLKVLIYNDGIVKGSNPFAVVLANTILNQEELRTANQADLEKILRAKTLTLTLNGQYENSGLVVRSEKNPNKYLANHLIKQLKTRGKVKFPVMLNLTDLELINDSGSNYGLAFKLREDAKPICASQLDNKNQGKKFSQTDENGLPIFSKEGNRALYTTDSGLSRVCLYCALGLGTWGMDLANSNEDGRVVVLSDGGKGK